MFVCESVVFDLHARKVNSLNISMLTGKCLHFSFAYDWFIFWWLSFHYIISLKLKPSQSNSNGSIIFLCVNEMWGENNNNKIDIKLYIHSKSKTPRNDNEKKNQQHQVKEGINSRQIEAMSVDVNLCPTIHFRLSEW